MVPPTPQQKPELSEDEQARADLLTAIDEGSADAERGDTVDGDEFFNQLEAELRQKHNLSAE